MKKRKQEPGLVQFVRVKPLRWWFVIIFLATGRSNGTFKWFYQRLVQKYWLADFPGLPIYNRFVELMSDVLIPIAAVTFLLRSQMKKVFFFDKMAYQESLQ